MCGEGDPPPKDLQEILLEVDWRHADRWAKAWIVPTALSSVREESRAPRIMGASGVHLRQGRRRTMAAEVSVVWPCTVASIAAGHGT